jgi:hypothetical protein
MAEYEDKMRKQLDHLIAMAECNPATGTAIVIETCGHEPFAKMRIPAYVLKGFLKS